MPHITAPVNPKEDEEPESFPPSDPESDLDVDDMDSDEVREELKNLLNLDDE